MTTLPYLVLLVNSNAARRAWIYAALDSAPDLRFTITDAPDPATLHNLLSRDLIFDITLSEMRLGSQSGEQIVEQVCAALPATCLLLLAESEQMERAAGIVGSLPGTVRGAVVPAADLGGLIEKLRDTLGTYSGAADPYRHVFEQARAVKLLLDPATLTVLDANHAARAFYGHDRLIGRTLGELSARQHENLQKAVRRLLKDANPILIDSHRTVDGETRDVEVLFSPITYEGRPVLDVIVNDVTERQRVERALLEDEFKLRAIVQHAEDIIYMKDAQLTYVLVNPAGARLFGKQPEDMLGRQDEDLFGEERARNMRAADQRVIDTGEAHTVEERLPAQGGGRIFLTNRFPYRSPQGAVLGLIGISHDITERYRAEEALRESEDRFKRISENAPDMIFKWTYARGFEYVSPAALDITGYTPGEYYDDPGLNYRNIDIEDLPAYEEVLANLADPEGARPYCVVRWHHRNGSTVHLEMRMAPLFDERGDLIGLEGIARDVSQHVLARARLQELSMRVTQAHEDERRVIAHELHDEIGQMLTVAKMRLKMVDTALPEDATAAQEKLGTLSRLLDETLQSVRALSHELRPPLLDEMGWEPALASLCDSLSQRTGLPIDFDSGGPTDRLPPDTELIAYRIVQESLTNIVRHAAATRARVAARLTQEALALSIEDDGSGFDMAALTRADKPTAGLGLLGMQERAERAGGHLTIQTVPGEGTRIRVMLPRKEPKNGAHQDSAG